MKRVLLMALLAESFAGDHHLDRCGPGSSGASDVSASSLRFRDGHGGLQRVVYVVFILVDG